LTEPEAIEHFTDLYVRNYRQVYAYAVSRAGRQLAEEVVSEVFLIAWRRLADVPVPALPWLLAVTRNEVLRQFRLGKEPSATGWHELTDQARATAADVADQVAGRLAVLTALESLPDADRELLILVAWHGLAPQQTARVVGCSTAAARVRLHRARRRLEQAMTRASCSEPEAPVGPAATYLGAGALPQTTKGTTR
jgi:RNA polymerase sigma-70 factor (ECF subfamily)